MLRLTVLLLLLANGGYFAWSQGLLLPWGIGPAQQSEPQRLQQQVRAELVQVLDPEELRRLEAQAAQAPPAAAAASAPAARAAECLASPLLEEAQVAPLRAALENWPAGSWQLEPVTQPGRWIVYLGKFADGELVARKRAELRQLGISFEPLSNAALEPGLSLGGYATEAAAVQQLQLLVERGVRSARIVQERPERRGQRLLLPAADDALRTRAEQLKTILADKSLRPCR